MPEFDQVSYQFLRRHFFRQCERATLCIDHYHGTRSRSDYAEAIMAIGAAWGTNSLLLQRARSDSIMALEMSKLVKAYDELKYTAIPD